jgi:thiamine kinase-like enzyme
MRENFSLKDNAEKLFNIVKKQNKNLVIKEDSSQVRNIVRKGVLEGIDCYVKIGFTNNMENLFAFTNHQLTPQNFNLPQYLLKRNFTYSNINFSYILIKEVPGISVYNSKRYEFVSDRIIDIVNEILEFPDLDLPRTNEYKKHLTTKEARLEYKKKIIHRLEKYYENSKFKYQNVYERATDLFNLLMNSDSYQLGTVHGEMNFHHIFIDSNDKIWIIDWERVSQAYLFYYDLAEYIARLIVSVENGTELAKTILNGVRMKDKSHLDTFKFCLYHRLLGTIWEKSDGEELFIDKSFEKKIITLIEDIKIDGTDY